MNFLRVMLLLAVSAPNLAAQTISTVPDCDGCSRIQTELVARLEHETLVDIREVFIDARGRYWVLNNNQLPTVFDSQGRFLAVAGRKGEGPLELERPQAIWQLPGDSVAVIELRGKAVVFGPDLQVQRGFSLPTEVITSSLVMSWPDRVLVSTTIQSDGSRGHPLHLLDLTSSPGRVVRSFGSDDSPAPGNDFVGTRYVIARSGAGGFWAAPRADYRVTRWSNEFSPLSGLQRRPEWFAEPTTLSSGGPETPPDPALDAIVEDVDGLLWTFLRVPSPDWKKAWTRIPDISSGGVPVSMIDWHHLHHSRIEVLDPRTRSVVARHRMDREVRTVSPGPIASFIILDALGVPSVRVVRFRLAK